MENILKKISAFIWEMPKTYQKGMKVPVRFIASKVLLEKFDQAVFQQAGNTATLPGLVGYVYIMPDAHSGYGASIGTVFASDPKNGGIISPGAVGFDISCGMRLITTNLFENEVRPKLERLVDGFFEAIPVGVGGKGFLRINKNELKEVVTYGAGWMVEKGFGRDEDLAKIEDNGRLAGADLQAVSEKAIERGLGQLATLGSGNHYLEIQRVSEIFDKEKAKELGITQINQIVVMLHCGSRGFGHQICTDYLRLFENHLDEYQIKVSDRQLASLPFESSYGQKYYQAMACAVNFAYANRQLITYQLRKVFERILGKSEEELGLELVYDVSHNIAKIEKQQIPDGVTPESSAKNLLVHRKGATRSYPNQPVIIGGSMETGSFLLLGTETALSASFGSTAHGSGRTMSRHAAKRQVSNRKLNEDLKAAGIYIRSASWGGLAEEAGIAYKNIDEVVEVVDRIGISKKIARLTPIGNIKG